MTPTRLGAASRRTLEVVCLAWAVTAASGCGGDSNEREFLDSTKPGIPSENPDEKVAERRSRLRNKSSLEKKIEKKAQDKAKAKG